MPVSKIKFSHSHLLQFVTFSATIIREDADTLTVRVPARVCALKFPPFGGKPITRA